MAEDALLPPKGVRGMRVLDRDAFRKVVSVPAIKVEPKHCSAVRQRFDGRLLTFKGVKTIVDDPQTQVEKCQKQSCLQLITPVQTDSCRQEGRQRMVTNDYLECL
jgi:hypothetical protein